MAWALGKDLRTLPLHYDADSTKSMLNALLKQSQQLFGYGHRSDSIYMHWTFALMRNNTRRNMSSSLPVLVRS
jgi:hypothetical protein